MQGSSPAGPTFDPASLPLKGYHLPEPVSWWPPAIGWWVTLLTVCGGIALSLVAWKRYKKKAWRREAVALLNDITQQFQERQDAHQLAQDISLFLRRVCRTRFPENDGTHLTGEDWLIFLDQCRKISKQKTPFFTNEVGHSLLESAYNPTSSVDGDQLLNTVRSWLANLPEKPWRSDDCI